MPISMHELLMIAVKADASDLHLTTYIPPRIRVYGELKSIDHPPLSPAEAKQLIYSILSDKQKKVFEDKLELDFSFGVKDLGRYPDSFRGAPAVPELFFNDQRMTPARWPNTRISTNEFVPSRFEPWTETHAHSPAA